ncbi:MAG: hypothetical protein ACLQDY_05530 [Streptosporangiaceae bacterium]
MAITDNAGYMWWRYFSPMGPWKLVSRRRQRIALAVCRWRWLFMLVYQRRFYRKLLNPWPPDLPSLSNWG